MRKSVFGGDGIATYVTVLVLVVSVLLNVFVIGCYRSDRCYRTERDTVYVYDTIRIVEPVPVKEEVVRYDTVYLQTIDTIVKMDSIEVIVPITQRVYEDSLYKAWVSGYRPRLDSLEVYRRIVYIDRIEAIERRPRVVVSAGVYGGFGVKGADYGLGVSVGMPIWSW